MNPKSVVRALIPQKPRYFPGQRGLNIALRSLHLIGVAGIGGGFLFTLDEAQWLPFWHLSLLTGIALTAIYIWTSALWLVQLKGLVIVFKLLLLWIAMLIPDWRGALFIMVIVLSAVIAHAPGTVRGYRPFGQNEPGKPGCS